MIPRYVQDGVGIWRILFQQLDGLFRGHDQQFTPATLGFDLNPPSLPAGHRFSCRLSDDTPKLETGIVQSRSTSRLHRTNPAMEAG
jgi:hypothetical protein